MRLLAMVVSAALIVAACEGGADLDPRKQTRSDSPAERASDNDATVGAKELLQLLAIDDESSIVAGLNEVKRRGASSEALSILGAIWREELENYPDLAWAALLEPLVRLEIIDILVQAAKNGEAASEPEGAHEFVRMLVQREPPAVASQGLITLAAFDRADDVSLIARLAEAQNGQMFRSAVIALSMMCANTAGRALDRLEREASVSDRTFVQDTNKRMSDYKRRTGQCE